MQNTAPAQADSSIDPFPRQIPEWYPKAKFGIFIHWGPGAVPGWAPQTTLNTQQMIKEEGLTYYFANNPYSIWYFNSMRIPGSPTQDYHKKVWNDQSYDIFGPMFNEQSAKDGHKYFEEWAEVFKHAGARYVVPVSKHHDGFTLWPTKVPHRKKDWGSKVDLIGKLREQVIAKGMRMGVYYSGMYDWSWNSVGIRNGFTAAFNGYQSTESVAYMDAHVRELIDLYKPEVLWNDIGYLTHPDSAPKNPAAFKSLVDLWEYYYKAVPTGVTDDRWYEVPAGSPALYPIFSLISRFLASPVSRPVSAVIDWVLKLVSPSYDKPGGLSFPPGAHWDYRTFEYTVPDDIQAGNWELVRGIGLAFLYNRNELQSQWLTFSELVAIFVDVVSKNGNMLLDVGPRADGSLQEHEKTLLLQFGDWMKDYGAALYDTTPWSALAPDTYAKADATDAEGGMWNIRFTVAGDALNVFFNSSVSMKEVLLPNVQPADSAVAALWRPGGERSQLVWRKDDAGTWLTLPRDLPDSPLQCVSIDPVPEWTG